MPGQGRREVWRLSYKVSVQAGTRWWPWILNKRSVMLEVGEANYFQTLVLLIVVVCIFTVLVSFWFVFLGVVKERKE